MTGKIFNNAHTIEFEYEEHHLRNLKENNKDEDFLKENNFRSLNINETGDSTEEKEPPYIEIGCDEISNKTLCK